MEVSVIICTYNRAGFLKSCIDSILSNTYPDFGLTIVDQSENNETKNLVNEYARYDNRIKYLCSKKGRTRALNLGIRRTIGEVIAKTDDDCVVSQDWIEKIVSFFALHPDAAIVLGDVIPGEYDASTEVIPMCRSRNRKYFGTLSMRKGIGMGANMSIKRWVFEKVGWFDEVLGSPVHLKSSDDWDFFYRTLAKGYSIYDTNLIKVQHNGRRNFEEAKKLWRGYQITTTAFLVKNLRCGDFTALLVLIGTTWMKFYELVWSAKFVSKSESLLSSLKSKLGKFLFCLLGIYGAFSWTFIGILKSLEYSVDKDKRLFIEK
jgi:glycosyltransferase involved in cell wall biosynthesis